jgi:oligopeptide/dipeptide ABC transporter ATP-binding protein
MVNDILRVLNVTKYYPVRKKFRPFSSRREFVRAVDNVSMNIPTSTTVAVVGESGCGKTTLARTIARLTPVTSGHIYLGEKSITDNDYSAKELYQDLQMVFQDPESSLDPHMTVGQSIAEPLRSLMELDRDDVQHAVERSLALVGLSKDFARLLPSQLSGGQKQRIAIARAMSPQPKLVILDEPTSALDASVQAQILRLLIQLQKDFHLSYLLITHNIAVAGYLSDRIAVMYSGNIVEYGLTETVLSRPRHPYTIALIASAPRVDTEIRSLLKTEIKGDVPSMINPPVGCKFHPRCPYAESICSQTPPSLEDISSDHRVACHFVIKTA